MSPRDGSDLNLHSVHIDLDGAWPRDVLSGIRYVDCQKWGPVLRYCATREGMAQFSEFVRAHRAKFTLFGSGDYHHLAAIWVSEIEEPFTLISFDNHPDWDVRPPHWCCGSWISRVLEYSSLRRVAVWGCGNFEFNWPSSIFANHRALRSGRLQVWPWTERLNPAAQKRWPGIQRHNWREEFSRFAQGLIGERVYVTVDMDCLRGEESTTNWENGLFRAEEIAWALREIASYGEIIGGDVCGAHSQPRYARWRQRMASMMDHPKQPPVDPCEAMERNVSSLDVIWSSLTGRNEHYTEADQHHACP